MLGHLGIFTSAHERIPHVPSLVITIAAVLWNGPAAVSVFFIISGFCIHLPYRGHRGVELKSFFSRRFLRVGIPALSVMAFEWFFLHSLLIANTVLWSVLCELIYYAMYPALLRLRAWIGWPFLIFGCYFLGLTILLSHLSRLSAAGNSYTVLGAKGTWLIGLPSWLMGCLLAEWVERFPTLKWPSIWTLRAIIFATSMGLRILKFHVSSGFASNAITLNLFAFLACFWLGCEIRYYESATPSTILEWAGEWSYSLYLVHPLVPELVAASAIPALVPLLQGSHLILIAIVLVMALLFHRAIEQPSHRFAVLVSRKLRRKEPVLV